MSSAWVAGSVRAKAVARRRVGAAGARALAASTSLEEALLSLAATPYRRGVRADQALAEAQHAVAGTLLWHLRVLAGWLPRTGAGMMHALAGAFEITNVDEHLRMLAGMPTPPSYQLGSLGTAWSRLAGAASPAELQGILASSRWGDPGEASPRSIRLGMRFTWTDRIRSSVPEAAPWVGGAAALLVARESHLAQHGLPEPTHRMAAQVLGPTAGEMGSLRDLASRIPKDARWALEGVDQPEDLWRAEARWWRRVGGVRLAAPV